MCIPVESVAAVEMEGVPCTAPNPGADTDIAAEVPAGSTNFAALLIVNALLTRCSGSEALTREIWRRRQRLRIGMPIVSSDVPVAVRGQIMVRTRCL